MAFDISKLKAGATAVTEWLTAELQTLRTGRASPALLDSVQVEMYGTRTPLVQCASVSVEDARSLYVSPWDKSQIKEIEKAIQVADLGVGVGSDDKGVRVTFPELTGERRLQLVRSLKSKLEDARVSLKAERNKAKDEIDSQKKEELLSEDAARNAEIDVQALVTETNAKLEALAAKKETELMN